MFLVVATKIETPVGGLCGALSVYIKWPEVTVGAAQTALSLLIITFDSYLSQHLLLLVAFSFPTLFFIFLSGIYSNKKKKKKEAKLARQKREERNAKLQLGFASDASKTTMTSFLC
ncbi:hypothetical protein SEVIR_4G210400v4 [Setaria viridis]|uniref:Uncharacterized protein n=1 Tax=Setaria viridis TaxID=4556 RepID=A0A4U6UZJ2_SETVI|nr:hypothetical protein SEVIR_4G210400v2 [Setaria viridis]